MADEVSQSAEFWNVIEEAEQTVAAWPDWKKRYEVDIYYDGYARGATNLSDGNKTKQEG